MDNDGWLVAACALCIFAFVGPMAYSMAESDKARYECIQHAASVEIAKECK